MTYLYSHIMLANSWRHAPPTIRVMILRHYEALHIIMQPLGYLIA